MILCKVLRIINSEEEVDLAKIADYDSFIENKVRPLRPERSDCLNF